MGSMGDKVKGVANQVGGKIKEETGEMLGNKQMESEGAAQKVKGKVQQSVGDAKSKIKDAADAVADKANKKL
jgi:uncharacterized protein YjbJ (UPF0337 family)